MATPKLAKYREPPHGFQYRFLDGPGFGFHKETSTPHRLMVRELKPLLESRLPGLQLLLWYPYSLHINIPSKSVASLAIITPVLIITVGLSLFAEATARLDTF